MAYFPINIIYLGRQFFHTTDVKLRDCLMLGLCDSAVLHFSQEASVAQKVRVNFLFAVKIEDQPEDQEAQA